MTKSQRQYANNRERRIAATRRWQKKNPDKARMFNIAAKLKQNFGMSLDEYNVMLVKQHGVCAICKSKPGLRRLAVDHCHSSGRIRALLCHHCNTGMGNFDDSIELLQRVIDYLQHFASLPRSEGNSEDQQQPGAAADLALN